MGGEWNKTNNSFLTSIKFYQKLHNINFDTFKINKIKGEKLWIKQKKVC